MIAFSSMKTFLPGKTGSPIGFVSKLSAFPPPPPELNPFVNAIYSIDWKYQGVMLPNASLHTVKGNPNWIS